MTRSRPIDDPGPGARPVSVPMAGFRRAHPSALPVTGAWRPGDHVGRRRFLALPADRPFALEGAGPPAGRRPGLRDLGRTGARRRQRRARLPRPHRRQPRAGGLDPGHAAPAGGTGPSAPGGPSTPTGASSCASTCSAAARAPPARPRRTPTTGGPWGSRFPVVSIRDMVRTQAAVADHLGIGRWLAIVGGSMGGMQALEWGVMYPDRVGAVSPSPPRRPPAPSRSAGGAPAGGPSAWTPLAGRRVLRRRARRRPARGAGHRPDDVDDDVPQRRRVQRPVRARGRRARSTASRCGSGSEVERYLEYQGDKLVRRFDANSYLILTKAMDLHDLAAAATGAAGVRAGCDVRCCRWASPATSSTRPTRPRRSPAGRRRAGRPLRRARQPARPRRVPDRGRPARPAWAPVPRRRGGAR